MAVDQTVNEEDEVDEALPEKKSKTGKVLLISFFILVLLIGGGIGAAVMLLDEETLNDLPFASMLLGSEADVGKANSVVKPPIYVELGDPFVVNFIQGNQVRYLQVRIEAMTRDPEIPRAIASHLPRIRHNLVFMFSAFDYVSLASVDGKTEVRDRALEEIQMVLQEETGKAGIEDVYFTSFVMQ